MHTFTHTRKHTHAGRLHQNGPPKKSKTFQNFGLKTLSLVFTFINKYLSYLNLNLDGY